jgi:outer membrane lipoprotein SlyB
MAYRGKLSLAQKFVLGGTVLGALIAARTTGQDRLFMFTVSAIGAIAGGVAYWLWKKRQENQGG